MVEWGEVWFYFFIVFVEVFRLYPPNMLLTMLLQRLRFFRNSFLTILGSLLFY